MTKSKRVRRSGSEIRDNDIDESGGTVILGNGFNILMNIVDCLPLCHLPVSINNFNKNKYLSLDRGNGEHTKILSPERHLVTSTELDVVCGIRDTHSDK